jgi:hypothetical protein
VITVRTTRFKTQKLYVMLAECIEVFCMDLGKTEFTFPYSINLLVFISEWRVFTVRYALNPLM